MRRYFLKYEYELENTKQGLKQYPNTTLLQRTHHILTSSKFFEFLENFPVFVAAFSNADAPIVERMDSNGSIC